MSDLVADSEDLLARIDRSDSPEVRALKEPILRSIDQLKQQLRSRAKSQTNLQDHARVRTEHRWMQAAAASILTAGVIAWLWNRSRQPA